MFHRWNAANMDATGADQLRARIEHQTHWRQADAVRQGLQPSVDPDGYDLEELGQGLRLYAVREQQRRIVDGRAALVTQRLTKQLVDGWWQTVYEPESIEYFDVDSSDADP